MLILGMWLSAFAAQANDLVHFTAKGQGMVKVTLVVDGETDLAEMPSCMVVVSDKPLNYHLDFDSFTGLGTCTTDTQIISVHFELLSGQGNEMTPEITITDVAVNEGAFETDSFAQTMIAMKNQPADNGMVYQAGKL